MSSIPETEDATTLETIYYEMVEQIMDAANTFIEMHPNENKAQIEKMVYLFTSVMAAFIDSMPGLNEEQTLSLAKNAYLHAKSLENKPKNESLN